MENAADERCSLPPSRLFAMMMMTFSCGEKLSFGRGPSKKEKTSENRSFLTSTLKISVKNQKSESGRNGWHYQMIRLALLFRVRTKY